MRGGDGEANLSLVDGGGLRRFGRDTTISSIGGNPSETMEIPLASDLTTIAFFGQVYRVVISHVSLTFSIVREVVIRITI